ncbi:hypothetical protein WG66_000716 [Moniliophthora roreri]|uniref:Thioesterase domain-containing protein n=1 Tax=Moniliophthora roreri TaxID=221103 RepID=A0A0W0FLP3_MONRR|nr:hypothetical protein WG66_000716 [Moniliophthora roreri]
MSLPSSFDVSQIRGNLTDAQKRTAAQTFAHFIGTPSTSFGAEIGRNLKIVEINVKVPTNEGGEGSSLPESGNEGEGVCWDEVDGVFGTDSRSTERPRVAMHDAMAQTICEIDVTKNMCNIFGNLHGGCSAYMIDHCSVSALVSLGIVAGIDGTGVSQSLSLQWYRPAILGTKLKIISTTVSLDGYIRTARSELRDRVDNTLYVEATHSTINKNAGRKSEKMPEPKL